MIMDASSSAFAAPESGVSCRPPDAPAAPASGPADPRLIDLVTRARAGNLAAQSELIAVYRRRVTGFVWPMVRDRETVQDLVQAISIKVVRRLPALRDPKVFEWWLFTLARNATLDHLRRARRRPILFVPDHALHDVRDPANDDRSAEIRELLDKVLRTTSPSNRRILEKIIIGTSYRQIAGAERISIGTLKARLHRLRQEIRRRAGCGLGDFFSSRRARGAASP